MTDSTTHNQDWEFEFLGCKQTTRKRFTASSKKSIIDNNPFCVYCGNTNYTTLTLDHIIPLYLGGENNISNITVACSRCNSHKGVYRIEHFFEILSGKREWIMNKLYSYTNWLRKLRLGKPHHFMHTEEVLAIKIQSLRSTHSYFSKIIRSILDEKYKIH